MAIAIGSVICGVGLVVTVVVFLICGVGGIFLYQTQRLKSKYAGRGHQGRQAAGRKNGLQYRKPHRFSAVCQMGVFQITAVNSNEISDYGINDTSSIEKEITAVDVEFSVK